MKPKGATGSVSRVVVVGAGFAGALATKMLDSTPGVHVTLVTPSEYFEDVTLQPAAIVSPGKSVDDSTAVWPTSVTPLKGNIVRNGELVPMACTGVHERYVEVGPDKRVIAFDYCLLAMGTSYSSAIKARNASRNYRWQQMVSRHAQLARAKFVLIIGGGLVGVEHSTDIKAKFPECRVVIVHRYQRLLPNIPEAHEKILPVICDEIGVELILGEDVTMHDEVKGTYHTSGGHILTPDHAVWCTGYTPNTDCVRHGSSALASQALDSQGFIQVDETLAVLGSNGRIFAAGDILTDMWFARLPGGDKAERTAEGADNTGAIAASNIQRLLKSQSPLWIDNSLRLDSGAKGVVISLGPKKALCFASPETRALFAMYGLVSADTATQILEEGVAFKRMISTMMMEMMNDWKPEEGEHMMVAGTLSSPHVIDIDAAAGSLSPAGYKQTAPEAQPEFQSIVPA